MFLDKINLKTDRETMHKANKGRPVSRAGWTYPATKNSIFFE